MAVAKHTMTGCHRKAVPCFDGGACSRFLIAVAVAALVTLSPPLQASLFHSASPSYAAAVPVSERTQREPAPLNDVVSLNYIPDRVTICPPSTLRLFNNRPVEIVSHLAYGREGYVANKCNLDFSSSSPIFVIFTHIDLSPADILYIDNSPAQLNTPYHFTVPHLIHTIYFTAPNRLVDRDGFRAIIFTRYSQFVPNCFHVPSSTTPALSTSSTVPAALNSTTTLEAHANASTAAVYEHLSSSSEPSSSSSSEPSSSSTTASSSSPGTLLDAVNVTILAEFGYRIAANSFACDVNFIPSSESMYFLVVPILSSSHDSGTPWMVANNHSYTQHEPVLFLESVSFSSVSTTMYIFSLKQSVFEIVPAVTQFVMCSEIASNLQVGVASGEVVSHEDYPAALYTPLLSCTFTILNPSPTMAIAIYVEDINIDSCCDAVTVRSGFRIKFLRQPGESFQGELGRSLRVSFETDSTGAGRGFHLFFQTVSPPLPLVPWPNIVSGQSRPEAIIAPDSHLPASYVACTSARTTTLTGVVFSHQAYGFDHHNIYDGNSCSMIIEPLAFDRFIVVYVDAVWFPTQYESKLRDVFHSVSSFTQGTTFTSKISEAVTVSFTLVAFLRQLPDELEGFRVYYQSVQSMDDLQPWSSLKASLPETPPSGSAMTLDTPEIVGTVFAIIAFFAVIAMAVHYHFYKKRAPPSYNNQDVEGFEVVDELHRRELDDPPPNYDNLSVSSLSNDGGQRAGDDSQGEDDEDDEDDDASNGDSATPLVHETPVDASIAAEATEGVATEPIPLVPHRVAVRRSSSAATDDGSESPDLPLVRVYTETTAATHQTGSQRNGSHQGQPAQRTTARTMPASDGTDAAETSDGEVEHAPQNVVAQLLRRAVQIVMQSDRRQSIHSHTTNTALGSDIRSPPPAYSPGLPPGYYSPPHPHLRPLSEQQVVHTLQDTTHSSSSC